MVERKFTDDEIVKAFDILDKFEFFGGQRAGREMWFNKPTDIQNKDIGGFLRDLDFLRQFINRQKAEMERLTETSYEAVSCFHRMESLYNIKCMELKVAKTEAIKEFAERLKASAFECDVSFGYGREHYTEAVAVVEIDTLVKEMTEDKP